MKSNATLISVHPCYAEKIISGEKKMEFRRSWATKPVDVLVIYATTPIQRIIALADVKQIFVGSKTKLWNLAKGVGGGISRRKLFNYLDGKKSAVAIELSMVKPIADGIDPKCIFGPEFRPPQSFRYLKDEEYLKLRKLITTCTISHKER